MITFTEWERNACSILVEKPEGKGVFVRPKCRWEGNVQTESGVTKLARLRLRASIGYFKHPDGYRL
jgi:hypothetical protein